MPVKDNVLVDPALTDISIAFGGNMYGADALFPVVRVVKDGGKYYIIDVLREGNRPGQTARAPGAESNVSDYKYTTGTFAIEDHAQAVIVPDEVQTNSDSAIAPFADATELATKKVLNGKEVDAAALAVAQINTESLNGGNKWDTSSGDPVLDVNSGAITINDAIQFDPNLFMCSKKIFRRLTDNPQMQELIKYGNSNESPTQLGMNAIATVFGVERVVITNAFTNTADKNATASQSEIWGNDAYLAYVPQRPGLRTMSLGYTFVWNPGDGYADGKAVFNERINLRRSDLVDMHYQYDQAIVTATAAVRFVDVVS